MTHGKGTNGRWDKITNVDKVKNYAEANEILTENIRGGWLTILVVVSNYV